MSGGHLVVLFYHLLPLLLFWLEASVLIPDTMVVLNSVRVFVQLSRELQIL